MMRAPFFELSFCRLKLLPFNNTTFVNIMIIKKYTFYHYQTFHIPVWTISWEKFGFVAATPQKRSKHFFQFSYVIVTSLNLVYDL